MYITVYNILPFCAVFCLLFVFPVGVLCCARRFRCSALVFMRLCTCMYMRICACNDVNNDVSNDVNNDVNNVCISINDVNNKFNGC